MSHSIGTSTRRDFRSAGRAAVALWLVSRLGTEGNKAKTRRENETAQPPRGSSVEEHIWDGETDLEATLVFQVYEEFPAWLNSTEMPFWWSMVCCGFPTRVTTSPGCSWFVFRGVFVSLFEDFPERTTDLHNRIQDESAQEPVESGRAPRPIAGSVEHDPQRDVAPNPETQGEYDPLAYHHSDRF